MKIYIDSREKEPWNFTFFGFEQEVIGLPTGDYYVEELPDLIIERKKSTGELANNLGKKWKQFEKEFQRMSSYKNAYLICEFPVEYLDIFPEKSGIPKKSLGSVRMNPGFIKSRLFSNCNKYNIIPLFFNNHEDALNAVVEIINNGGNYDNRS